MKMQHLGDFGGFFFGIVEVKIACFFLARVESEAFSFELRSFLCGNVKLRISGVILIIPLGHFLLKRKHNTWTPTKAGSRGKFKVSKEILHFKRCNPQRYIINIMKKCINILLYM